jgi:hypothetical protein
MKKYFFLVLTMLPNYDLFTPTKRLQNYFDLFTHKSLSPNFVCLDKMVVLHVCCCCCCYNCGVLLLELNGWSLRYNVIVVETQRECR